MKRTILVLSLVCGTAGLAFADGTRVRASATVEVLDDKAQIDDVISRMKAGEKAQPEATRAGAQAASLKQERPAPPSANEGSHRQIAPEQKGERPGTRRSNRERNGNPDHTERTRHPKRN